MKIVIAFALGILLALGAVWFMSDPQAREEVREVGKDIENGMESAGQKVKQAVDEIDTEEMKENIKETGREIADATKEAVSDASITASIKTKLAADSTVSALSIDVDTTDGVVTLSGKVESADEAKQALSIASQVEGVKQVLSTLQIKSDPQPVVPNNSIDSE